MRERALYVPRRKRATKRSCSFLLQIRPPYCIILRAEPFTIQYMNEIREKLKLLPENPGVYVMLDKDGNVIYVGKARVLKNRVRQYFHSSVKTEKVAAMVACIADFYYIITKSEIDALALENNLIKNISRNTTSFLKTIRPIPTSKSLFRKSIPPFRFRVSCKRGANISVRIWAAYA